MRYHELVEAPEGLTFNSTVQDMHSGQIDQRLTAQLGGTPVGHIDFSTYEGSVHIRYISVPDTLRKRGIARAMLSELQRMHPDTEIDWGMLTDDGAELYKRVPMTTVEIPEIKTKMDRLADLKAREAQWQEIADRSYESPTPENKAALQEIIPQWNELHDEIWQLEQELRDARATKTLITR